MKEKDCELNNKYTLDELKNNLNGLKEEKIMRKCHETHDLYILDSLEDDKLRIIKGITDKNPEYEYDLNRLIEVVAEIVEKSKVCC
jgi:hypothetical protein